MMSCVPLIVLLIDWVVPAEFFTVMVLYVVPAFICSLNVTVMVCVVLFVVVVWWCVSHTIR